MRSFFYFDNKLSYLVPGGNTIQEVLLEVLAQIEVNPDLLYIEINGQPLDEHPELLSNPFRHRDLFVIFERPQPCNNLREAANPQPYLPRLDPNELTLTPVQRAAVRDSLFAYDPEHFGRYFRHEAWTTIEKAYPTRKIFKIYFEGEEIDIAVAVASGERPTVAQIITEFLNNTNATTPPENILLRYRHRSLRGIEGYQQIPPDIDTIWIEIFPDTVPSLDDRLRKTQKLRKKQARKAYP